jgi:hypothetical protein
MAVATFCAAAVSAQLVSGKAVRDALFLTSLDFTALPTMLMASSAFSIAVIAGHTRLAARVAPSALLPGAFLVSGLLFLAEWLTRSTAPAATAVLVYLHVTAATPLVASGLWLMATERFDPHSAKKRFGQLAGAGTLGGLLGAVAAERVAALAGVPAMLLVLGVCQCLTAWFVRRLIAAQDRVGRKAVQPGEGLPTPLASGLRAVSEAPYLRQLALLVVLGTTGAALVDYVFKARAVETFGPGDNLLRFFALYYAATSLITFVLQTSSSHAVLERFGLALTTSTPSIALLAGSAASLIAPGFGALVVARAGESIFRSSWFRAGYELFYTPIPAAEKRGAKSVIDVAFDRLGDGLGGGLARVAVVFLPFGETGAILAVAAAISVAAIVVASSLNRWYLQSLEHSVVEMARDLDPATTARMASVRRSRRRPATVTGKGLDADDIGTASLDPGVAAIVALRSRDRARVLDVLASPRQFGPGVVAHVIPLLTRDAIAESAAAALRQVADAHVGELTDALLDPEQHHAVRRRLARVFSACRSQRAADGLLAALSDLRFDVRCEAAQSLAAVLARNAEIRIDRERIYAVVRREVAAGQLVWENRRLLGAAGDSPFDNFVRDRSGQSLGHIVTLLSLVLPRDPLQMAFRGLRSGHPHLRGTALEYLEGVLPPAIRQQLWPLLTEPAA